MMRGAPDDSPPRREKTYAGAGVSPEVKDHTARFAVELQAHGVSMSIILSSLQGTEYRCGTLREHMAAVKRNEAPLSGEKEAGRHPALTDEQWAIVFGRVLRQTKPVALEDVQRWIKANLGMDVSIATVSRHKDEMGLSFQLTGSRGTKPGLTQDEYILGFFECVLDLRRTGFFEFDHRHIICIDFVTNSMRIERRKTLGLIGAKQKKLEKSDASYTNSYIVGVSLQAGPKLLSLMFTYDPAFDPKGPRAREVQQWCDANKIQRDQIYYEKSARKYCKESRAQVIEFECRNRVALTGARVIHNQGGAFKLDHEYILGERADRVAPLPSSTVSCLSWTTSSMLWQSRSGGAISTTVIMHGMVFCYFWSWNRWGKTRLRHGGPTTSFWTCRRSH